MTLYSAPDADEKMGGALMQKSIVLASKLGMLHKTEREMLQQIPFLYKCLNIHCLHTVGRNCIFL